LFGFPASTLVTVPTELSAVTQTSLFLDYYKYLLAARFVVKLNAKNLFLLIESLEF